MSIQSYHASLNSDNPDIVYEDFWLTFKDSIFNSVANMPDCQDLCRQIEANSSQLNKVQEEKDDGWVKTIKESISDNMRVYAIICLGTVIETTYHYDILVSNLHRWIEINNKRERSSDELLILLYETMKCKSYIVDELREELCRIFREHSHIGIVVGLLVETFIKYNQSARLNRLLQNDIVHDQVIDVFEEICPFHVDQNIKESRKLIARMKNN
jgi:hypothetical protein